MVVALYDPMVAEKKTPLYKLELAMIELIIMTIIDKSVFPKGDIPESYLQLFNAFRANGIQRIETSLWYRYPILRYLAPDFSGYKWITETNNENRNTLDQIISLHQLDEHRERSSYLDSYLKKIDEEDESDQNKNMISNSAKMKTNWRHAIEKQIHVLEKIDRECLLSSLEDFLLGSEGILFAFDALLYCLAKHPKVQEKMRQEIENVKEKEESETKASLPYCWAVILETLRIFPQTGFGTPHHSDQTVYIDGFEIPAGTDVYPNLLGILRNPDYWNNPDEFQPERFLDDNNQVKPRKHHIPFQIGARVCPGKSFSTDLLFKLAMRVVTELNLSFDGFVTKFHEKSSGLGELRYMGMSLVHHHPFHLKVEPIVETMPTTSPLLQTMKKENSIVKRSVISNDIGNMKTSDSRGN